MSIRSKAEDGLKQLNALVLRSGTSAANQKALATAKEDLRAIVTEGNATEAEVTRLSERIAALEAQKPAPEPEPLPAPPAPVTDLRPWMTPLAPSQTVGERGTQTKLTSGIYKSTRFLGMIRVEKGVEVHLSMPLFEGPHGLGASGTLLYVLPGGKAVLEYPELTGSEGRSGLYSLGDLILIEPWIHDNGVGGGKLFQQLYVGQGRILESSGGLIENGEDHGVQLYSPNESGYGPITHLDWDGPEVRNCGKGANPGGGLIISGNVTDCHFTNVKIHDNDGYGVYGYEPRFTGTVEVSGNVWANSQGNLHGSGVTTTGVVQAAS